MIKDFVHVLLMSKEMFQLGFMGKLFSMDHPIVHVAGENSSVDPGSELCVDHRLECRRGVRQAKEHNCWLKEAFGCEESSFPFIPFSDPDAVIPPSYIELCE